MIDTLKTKYDELILDVYESNHDAIRFYEREGFEILETNVDENTGLIEKTMAWPREI